MSSLTNPAFRMRTKWAISKVQGNVLEIGCSKGLMTTMIHKDHKIVACDIDIHRLKEARHNAKINANFILCDAHALPFNQKVFDSVLLIDVLEHLRNPISVLEEANRVAKKKIIINVPNYGFSSVAYPNLLPEHFIEPTHLHQTTFPLLRDWLETAGITKFRIVGSYIPLPLPFIPFSYLLERVFKAFHIGPLKLHFQISAEAFLE